MDLLTFLARARKVTKETRQGANRLNFAFAKFCARFPLWNPLLFLGITFAFNCCSHIIVGCDVLGAPLLPNSLYCKHLNASPHCS